MPEVLDTTHLPVFPAGQGKGGHFTPLPQDVKDGRVRAHTLQTINADRQTLYKMWRDVTLAPKFQEYVVSVVPVSPSLGKMRVKLCVCASVSRSVMASDASVTWNPAHAPAGP